VCCLLPTHPHSPTHALTQVCPHLSKHAQRYLARAARIIDCRRDDVLYRVGDVGQYFYIVLDGEVELCQVGLGYMCVPCVRAMIMCECKYANGYGEFYLNVSVPVSISVVSIA
jgi:hypothetical protein